MNKIPDVLKIRVGDKFSCKIGNIIWEVTDVLPGSRVYMLCRGWAGGRHLGGMRYQYEIRDFLRSGYYKRVTDITTCQRTSSERPANTNSTSADASSQRPASERSTNTHQRHCRANLGYKCSCVKHQTIDEDL